jgi:ADP-heptose:LPS heptosyltransferase
MSRTIAFATLKSFGDFVIAHSVLNTIEENAMRGIRLIAGDHIGSLRAVLPGDVPVIMLNSGENRVPAFFDMRRRGTAAAVRSALSLRRQLQQLRRDADEPLVFFHHGVRERFIAGRWPLMAPRKTRPNIYETYREFLNEQQIRVSAGPLPVRATDSRSVGVFPEAGRIVKRLTPAVLAVILDRARRAGMDAKLFILEGDSAPQSDYPRAIRIPRNFASLVAALTSVDCVISADSLPAHLAEYFARPVFVASPRPNEYWLPHTCYTKKHWGLFGSQRELAASLDSFLAEQRSVA